MTTRKIRALRSLALAVGLSLSASAGASAAPDPENTLLIDMDDGQIVIEMRPDLAPNHVARIKELTREGFYDGVVFHRVIEGFMAQTGDPTGTGMGGSTYPDLVFVQGTGVLISVDKIKRGAGQSGKVNDPDAMLKVRIAADAK